MNANRRGKRTKVQSRCETIKEEVTTLTYSEFLKAAERRKKEYHDWIVETYVERVKKSFADSLKKEADSPFFVPGRYRFYILYPDRHFPQSREIKEQCSKLINYFEEAGYETVSTPSNYEKVKGRQRCADDCYVSTFIEDMESTLRDGFFVLL